jgi:predicted RNase H-like HicB family nuclease
MKLTIELEREEDGRWIGGAPEIAGAMCYGETREEAIRRVEALVLRIVADRIEHGEAEAEPLALSIEVARRELKSEFGVGQAQARNGNSVARQPALAVATYSALHLGALQRFGARRPECFDPAPGWQREKTRASCQDFIRVLRGEVVDNPDLVAPFDLKITETSILAAATFCVDRDLPVRLFRPGGRKRVVFAMFG